MFDFDELAEVEAKFEDRHRDQVPSKHPNQERISYAGVDTKLNGTIDPAALELPDLPRTSPSVSSTEQVTHLHHADVREELREHVGAVVAATADLGSITPKLVLRELSKRLGRDVTDLRQHMRLIQELARTEIQRRIALQAATPLIEVPRFAQPPGGRRKLMQRRQLEDGTPEARAQLLLAKGATEEAVQALAEALRSTQMAARKAELLLLRGHALWRDAFYRRAHEDLAEAEQLQAGGAAGASLLALRFCLGLDLEQEQVKGNEEVKCLVTEASTIFRSVGNAVASSRHLFRPRAAEPARDCNSNPTWAVPGMRIFDGRLEIESSSGYPAAEIGYRLIASTETEPEATTLLLYYHGNGEVVSDYTSWADVYQKFPSTFLAFDYREYGWSTGKADVGCLTRDPVVCMRKLPELLRRHGLPWPWPAPVVLMGRSLGSLVAGSLVAKFPDLFDGLIIESGVASSKEQRYQELIDWSGGHAPEAEAAINRLGALVAEGLPEGWLPGQDIMAPLGTCDGVRSYRGPVLVLHGTKDTLVTMDNARNHFEAAVHSSSRDLVEIDGDHNTCAGVAEFWKQQILFVRKLVQERRHHAAV